MPLHLSVLFVEMWWHQSPYCRYTAEHASERILKIGQHLTKLRNFVTYVFGPRRQVLKRHSRCSSCCWNQFSSVKKSLRLS